VQIKIIFRKKAKKRTNNFLFQSPNQKEQVLLLQANRNTFADLGNSCKWLKKSQT